MFDVADAPYFFGRERLTAHLVTRLVGSRLLAVVGGSGVGKSSAVRAGLLPALHTGTLPGSSDWTTIICTPADGIPVLEGTTAHTVVVIDQFEELFSSQNPDTRAAYLGELMRIVRSDLDVAVVITLRANYYQHCAQDTVLAAAVADNTVLVAPMEIDELRSSVEEPALRANLTFDEGLVDVLLADVAGQPGALPLLSTALLALWEHRDLNRLTMRCYVATGGVREAINVMAEAAYARLADAQRLLARRLLLRLADRGEGGDYVRRRAPLVEMVPTNDIEARRVIDILSQRRLISVTGDSVEIAHEAVLREWPRLRSWLDDDENGRRLRSHVSVAAREWVACGRDPAELYRGARLSTALDWLDQHSGDLTAPEREFLEAGRTAAEVEAQRRRLSIRRLRQLVSALAGVLVLALGATTVAVVQSRRADSAALAADARALRVHAATDERWDRALLYAVQADRLEPSADSRAALLSALQRVPEAIGVWRADTRVQRFSITANGSRLAVGERTGRVLVWDTTTQQRIADVNAVPDMWAPSVTLSDDGHLLVAAGYSVGPPGLTGDPSLMTVTDLTVASPVPQISSLKGVVDAAFIPGTHTLIVRQTNGALRLADPVTGTEGTESTFDNALTTGDCTVPYLHLSPSGRFVATGCTDSPTQPAGVWDTHTGRRIWLAPNGTTVLSVNSSGTTAIRGRADGQIDVVDLNTGTTTTPANRHDAAVYTAAWSQDGSMFATAAEQTTMVWSRATLQPIAVLKGHSAGVRDAVFSPDGRTLYTGATDDNIFVWDLDGQRRLAQPVGHSAKAHPLLQKFNDSGSVVASVYGDGTVDLTNLGSKPDSFTAVGFGSAGALEFDMDAAGKTVAYLGYDDTVGLTARLLDVASRQWRPFTIRVEPPIPNGPSDGHAMAISADGRILTTVDFDGRVRRWDTTTGAPRTDLSYQAKHDTYLATESPDGRQLALSNPSGIELIDLAGSSRVSSIPIAGMVSSTRPAFSPNGLQVAIGTDPGEINIIDTANAHIVRQWSATNGSQLSAVTFSPDGDYLFTSAGNGRAVLWNIDEAPDGGAVIDLSRPGGNPLALGFRGSGGALTMDSAGSVLLWDIDADSLAARACATVARSLSLDEWNAVLPQRPYEQTCPARL